MPNYADNADERLVSEAKKGNIGGVKSALAAGASVDGSGELAGMPLGAAVIHGNLGVAKLLVEKGANLGIFVHRDAYDDIISGELAVVQIAAIGGQLDMLRFLLRAGANPNCANELGCTPLMEVCQGLSTQRVLLMKELLNGGADPVQLDQDGEVALHYAARQGHVDVMDTLLSHAPTTLNHASLVGVTPLGAAANSGSVCAVSTLLSAGANNMAGVIVSRRTGKADYNCPLKIAIAGGHDNVVNLLLGDGFEAVGGLSIIPVALACAVQCRRSRILHRLLNVEGESRQRYWARCRYENESMVFFAAAHVDPAGMGVLLAAGVDETVRDPYGLRAKDVVGLRLPNEQRDALKEAAVHRVLKQAPAYRAQSWRWPSRRATGTPAAAAAAAAAAADVGAGAAVAPLSRRAPRTPLNVRVFRPRDRTSLVKNVGRYAEKL